MSQASRIGDVIIYHRVEHVVIFRNESRSLIIPLTYGVTWKDMPTGHTHFMAEGKGESISPTFEPEDVIRHMTVAEMKNHFGGNPAYPSDSTNPAGIESSSVMKKNQTAAKKAATTATATKASASTPTAGVVVPPTAPVVTAPPVVAAPAPGTPAPVVLPVRPKVDLNGRMAFVNGLAAKFDENKPEDVIEFAKQVKAVWPMCNLRWCTIMLVREKARVKKRLLAQQAVAEEVARIAALNAQRAAAAINPAPAPVAPVASPVAPPAPTNGEKVVAPTAQKGKKGAKHGKKVALAA